MGVIFSRNLRYCSSASILRITGSCRTCMGSPAESVRIKTTCTFTLYSRARSTVCAVQTHDVVGAGGRHIFPAPSDARPGRELGGFREEGAEDDRRRRQAPHLRLGRLPQVLQPGPEGEIPTLLCSHTFLCQPCPSCPPLIRAASAAVPKCWAGCAPASVLSQTYR